MRIYKLDDTGKTRWVQPFPDEAPDFQVEMRRIPEAETNRILDSHKLMPNSPKASMTKISAFSRDILERQIVSWKGAEVLGISEIDGEVTSKTKLALAALMVEHVDDEGEKVIETLGSLLWKKFTDLEAADEKN